MNTLLLIISTVLFGLVGFGVADGSEHFQLVPIGLALVALALSNLLARVRD